MDVRGLNNELIAHAVVGGRLLQNPCGMQQQDHMGGLTRCRWYHEMESCQLVRNIWPVWVVLGVVRVIRPTATTDTLGRRRRRLQLEGGQARLTINICGPYSSSRYCGG